MDVCRNIGISAIKGKIDLLVSGSVSLLTPSFEFADAQFLLCILFLPDLLTILAYLLFSVAFDGFNFAL